ncbi:MAG TPA: nuclear transport factor 2 family protein [Candidatus Acidoferrales bacterium]|nr:nuclear transport factor 2 family protein [Candidatus Acidoferrales bacterium]
MKTRGSGTRKPNNNSRSTRATLEAVIRLERKVWKAAQESDAKTFRELVPSDAMMIFQSGIVLQPEYLATMNKRTISRYELRRIRGFMPNATTVILYYEALRLGEEGGRTFPAGAVIESTTWIKRGARWVAILNQETPITAG